MKLKIGAATLLLTLVAIDQAAAGFFEVTPNPPPVPEFDGSSSVAVIALLASVAAIILQKSRSR
jgi:hypothetical protein